MLAGLFWNDGTQRGLAQCAGLGASMSIPHQFISHRSYQRWYLPGQVLCLTSLLGSGGGGGGQRIFLRISFLKNNQFEVILKIGIFWGANSSLHQLTILSTVQPMGRKNGRREKGKGKRKSTSLPFKVRAPARNRSHPPNSQSIGKNSVIWPYIAVKEAGKWKL